MKAFDEKMEVIEASFYYRIGSVIFSTLSRFWKDDENSDEVEKFFRSQLEDVFGSIVKEVIEENKQLRTLLWGRHGCGTEFQDGPHNGERGCTKCKVDFQRMPVREIAARFCELDRTEFEEKNRALLTDGYVKNVIQKAEIIHDVPTECETQIDNQCSGCKGVTLHHTYGKEPSVTDFVNGSAESTENV